MGADPEDHGVRRALNLGHTFGHAIEAASGYRVSHGDAVAAGLLAAIRLGASMEVTPLDLHDRVVGLLEGIGLRVEPPDLAQESLVTAMGADKKRRAGRSMFVVPTGRVGAFLVEFDPTAAARLLVSERVGHG